MLVEAAGRLMIPIAIVMAASLILLILRIVFGSIKAGIWLVLLVVRTLFFGVFVALFWIGRWLGSGIRALWLRFTS